MGARFQWGKQRHRYVSPLAVFLSAMFLKVVFARLLRHKSSPAQAEMNHALSRCHFHDGSVPMAIVMHTCVCVCVFVSSWLCMCACTGLPAAVESCFLHWVQFHTESQVFVCIRLQRTWGECVFSALIQQNVISVNRKRVSVGRGGRDWDGWVRDSRTINVLFYCSTSSLNSLKYLSPSLFNKSGCWISMWYFVILRPRCCKRENSVWNTLLTYYWL